MFCKKEFSTRFEFHFNLRGLYTKTCLLGPFYKQIHGKFDAIGTLKGFIFKKTSPVPRKSEKAVPYSKKKAFCAPAQQKTKKNPTFRGTKEQKCYDVPQPSKKRRKIQRSGAHESKNSMMCPRKRNRSIS